MATFLQHTSEMSMAMKPKSPVFPAPPTIVRTRAVQTRLVQRPSAPPAFNPRDSRTAKLPPVFRPQSVSPVLQAKPAFAPFRALIQRAVAANTCPACNKSFPTPQELVVHRSQSCTTEIELDEMSDWTDESLDSGDEREAFATSNKRSKQAGLYRKHKHRELPFHTSAGLAGAVRDVGHGGAGQFAANTHALLSGVNSTGTPVRVMANLSTLNAMKAYAYRHGALVMSAASNVFGKSQHIHAEMYLLAVLTGGDESKIPGCMAGMHLVVDKPICQQCYPFVKLAAPDLVDDGVNFNDSMTGRGDFSASWKTPFTKKLQPRASAVKNPFL